MSARAAPTLDEVRSKRREIVRVLEANRARNPRAFGSVARGDAVPESDVEGEPVVQDAVLRRLETLLPELRTMAEHELAEIGRDPHVEG